VGEFADSVLGRPVFGLKMNTIFANVLNIRSTPTELVLEFGSFFPDRPNIGISADYKPEVRVVLNPAVLPGLLDGLTNVATAAGQAGIVKPTEQKRPVGFAGSKE
jgi:hypothetical protein